MIRPKSIQPLRDKRSKVFPMFVLSSTNIMSDTQHTHRSRYFPRVLTYQKPVVLHTPSMRMSTIFTLNDQYALITVIFVLLYTFLIHPTSYISLQTHSTSKQVMYGDMHNLHSKTPIFGRFSEKTQISTKSPNTTIPSSTKLRNDPYAMLKQEL